ncbi:hypothetical protein F2Q68_00023746 [Brassica cretica]|uniref:Uncharacterized protein n=1 Tax=Brassica cretica TaxID=69181 RepID=A0A8S9I9E7_BRACR|nr:hypothetical protein F2Q68_00023746 [Brassica cretica]
MLNQFELMKALKYLWYIKDVDSEKDSSDDGMPPLEANTNRLRPFGVQCETDSDF